MTKKDKRKSNIEDVKFQIKKVNVELKDNVFIYSGPMSVSEFALKIKKDPIEIIQKFFVEGQMFNLNSTLNEELIAKLCIDYGFDFQLEKSIDASNVLENLVIEDSEKDLVSRPPVVTIMGHVDHGKTTLLDEIRKTRVAQSESGGITQHTGAYQVKLNNGKKITFLDTPGHEAFTLMRARGAKVTDIVVLVVAADDGIKQQSKEAIDHALAAKVPIIVFINKMDKVENKNFDKIKQELSQARLVPEEWGGDTIIVYGSALKNEGIDELLNVIDAQADILMLKANRNRLAIGTIIESKIDKGQGITATIIIQNGTLFVGDFIVAGSRYGRIRNIKSTTDMSVLKEGLPGMPAVVTGLKYLPHAGDKFIGFKEEKFAKQLANEKLFNDKQALLKKQNVVSNNESNLKIKNIIIKTDVDGTAEAIKNSLSYIANEEAAVQVIRASAGMINESDILLAKASNAAIYGFNIQPSSKVKEYAKHEQVPLFSYTIIYQLIDEISRIIQGMKAPKFEDVLVGKAQVLLVIFSSKIGNIAGSKVISGNATIDGSVKVYRNNKLIHTGTLDSLKREANNVKKVEVNKEFGCHIKGFNEIEVDDIIEFYNSVEVAN